MAITHSLNDKVVLVTGALTAVGQQLSREIASMGAYVSLVDTQADGSGEQLADAINTHTGRNAAIYLQTDLRQSQDIRLMIEATVLTFGHLDVLVNNAQSITDDMCGEEDVQRISDSIDVNLRAPVVATWVFARYLRQAERRGVVVNVAAMAGLIPGRGREVYGAANAGLIHFTEANRELANEIRVCALAPYYLDGLDQGSRLLPGNRLGKALTLSPEQVVSAVIRCIGDERLRGRTLLMAGGSSYTHTWSGLLARLHMFVIMLWSLVALLFARIFRRPVTAAAARAVPEDEAFVDGVSGVTHVLANDEDDIAKKTS
ncbi:hypothetical protein GGI05_001240 [Coemansia sp. RSA 2603]|nr:hypothetical protein GGI05_001240 [Coemansia sp. RSA 2603]